MASLGYSTCTIEFKPTNKKSPKRQYSDRSLIEICQDSGGGFFFRGVDVENKTEIFCIPFDKPSTYRFGLSVNIYDELHCENGKYRLLLNVNSYATFHRELEGVLNKLASQKGTSSNVKLGTSRSNKALKVPAEITVEENILFDVRNLSECIRAGQMEKAAGLAQELARKGLQFKTEVLDSSLDDKIFDIQVKVDGINVPYDGGNNTCTLNVYRSTTIDDLRALFEDVCHFPRANQYFFVNGHLAYGKSTMADLGVGNNSLFVLFLSANNLKDNQMSVLVYSTCRMKFKPTSEHGRECDYSERTTIELHQYATTDYSLRAIDVEKNRTEIFNFPLKNSDQYEFGDSDDEPDEIKGSSGTYQIWLNTNSRESFQETLCAVFQTVFSEISDPTDSNSGLTTSSCSYTQIPQEKKPPIPDPVFSNPKDFLIDVQNLSQYLRQGQGDEAARLAKQMVSHGLRLKVRSLTSTQNEHGFPISVQIDGNEYGIDQNGGKIQINVFPSTTVGELRAAFEVAYRYLPTCQYFFVNGKLLQDDSTMRDLRVGSHSLFVLFLLAHPKQFKTNDPWKCSVCTGQNSSDTLRCRTCLASRIE